MSKKIEHNVMRVIYLLALVSIGLVFISPFLVSIIFAATVALAMFPLQLKLEKKGVKRKRAAVILTSVFTILISLPFSFFLVKGTIAVTHQLEKFQTDERYKDQGMQSIVTTLKKDLMGRAMKYSEKLGIESFLTPKRMDGYLIQVNNYLLGYFQDFAANLPNIFLYFLIMILCLYAFLKEAQKVKRFFQSLFGFTDSRMNQLVRIFVKDSRQVYVSNIATGGIQSLFVSTGVMILGLGDFFLVFFVTLILSFIPVIGAAPVAFVFAAAAYFQDQTTSAIILVALGLFTGVVDNILRPFLASLGESKIPPIVAFIYVIGGALLMGFPGLFIGLLVGSFAYDTIPIFWEELGKRTERRSLGEILLGDKAEEETRPSPEN